MVFVGGGTGGHVTPLVALAAEIHAKYPSWEIYYLGATNDKIGQSLTKDNPAFTERYFVHAGKWHRFGNIKKRELLYFWRASFWVNAFNFWLLLAGLSQSYLYLRKVRPNLLFSKGGYVAFGPCWAARHLKIPLVLHDSDAVPGVAHSLFKRSAYLQLIGLQGAEPNKHYRHVGIPVKPAFLEELSEEQRQAVLVKYDLPPEAEFVLVTGGGGGARNLNYGILKLVGRLRFKTGLYFIIIAGGINYKATLATAAKLKSGGSRVRILNFVNDMPDLIRASLGVVTRAGATVLTEISLARKASIIVPNAQLPRAHQVHNARIFQRAGAAWLVSDDGKINIRALKQALEEMIYDEAKRQKYAEKAGQIAIPDAALKILEALEEVLLATNKKLYKAFMQDKSQNDAQVVFARAKRKRFDKHRLKRAFKLVVLFLIVWVAIVKISYVGTIRLNLIEESPFIMANQLEELEREVNDLADQESFLKRHFGFKGDKLREHLLAKGYIKDVSVKRDLIRSEIVIAIQPKYILGSFIAPNSKTVVTTDGYALKGFEHLLEEQNLAFVIKSSKTISQNQELVLSPLDVSFLNQIKTYLALNGYSLNEARISKTPREIVFRLKDYDLDIIALTTRDPIEQGIALIMALDFFAESERKNESLRELLENAEGQDLVLDKEIVLPTEYVDVRLINRVVYK